MDGITKNCSKYDAIYVFELLPLQNASLKLAFKPKEPMVLNDQLSIHVLGMKGVDVDPSSLKLSFPTDLRGLMSPLKVSRTEILFRDKIFYNPELNDKIGTSLSTFQSVSLCETIELTNVTDQPFNWTLDRKRLNSADSTSRRTNSAVTDKDGNAVKETMSVVFDDTHLVFQYNTRFGHLAPGETARFSVTFVPLAVGRYSSIVPIYADIHGQVSHMTSLELAGACVEPSLAFSPPEIFIPVLPPGEEVMVAFSVVSYGYERNDISCAFGDDLKLLLVGADKELKRNAATANDQTAIPNKGKAMVGESSGIVAREDHHGAARLFFPEGRQLKRDGEPLMVVLKFKAPARQPTAFTSRLCFAVNASRETPALNPHTSDTSYLMIHGSSDSSALTVWPFHEQKLAMDEFALLQTTGAYENVAKLKTKVLERLRSLDFGAEKVIHK